MIDEKKLVSDIKEYFRKHIDDETMDVDDVLNVNKDICGIIKSQPNVAVTDTNVGCKWITCSERMPEENTEVLIARKKNKHEINIGYRIKVGGWYDQCYNRFVDDVLAWMPLPEPYREDGEQNG